MDGVNDLLQSGGYLTTKPTGTAVSADVLSGKTFANSSNLKNTGTMPNKVGSNIIFTPGTADIPITQGYYGGVVTDGKILGDADLIASNIKSGVNIFNVAGNFTADATATVSQILSGSTAYVNGNKITGNMANNGSKTFTPTSSVQTSGAGYYSGITVNATSLSYTGSFTTDSSGYASVSSIPFQPLHVYGWLKNPDSTIMGSFFLLTSNSDLKDQFGQFWSSEIIYNTAAATWYSVISSGSVLFSGGFSFNGISALANRSYYFIATQI